MDFARVEAEFRRLKAQFERGALTEAEFKAQLEELMIEDEGGRWWILGYETGQWYVHDGEKWVQQEPPRAALGALPAHPQRPGAAGLTPDSQPRPAVVAPSRPALGLRLGRDGVSVLLITAGWLVCWGVVMWVYYLVDSRDVGSPFAIAGATGGLIAGLVLRRTEPPSPWKQVPVVTLGWGIGMIPLWILSMAVSRIFSGAVCGLVGGGITALALKWTQPSIQWKHIALVTLGWAIGWAVGGAIVSSVSMPIYLEYALWAAIGGAVGSWVTFWQLREARLNTP